MLKLHELFNDTLDRRSRKRVGRGPGSGLGKTSGRGHKGAGSRSGYKRRHTYEGGQFRLFQKIPIRGFSNARFKTVVVSVNLGQIERFFEEGEVVNEQSLREKRLLSGRFDQLKILGDGQLTKKLTIEAHAFSQAAEEKLKQAKIDYQVVGKK